MNEQRTNRLHLLLGCMTFITTSIILVALLQDCSAPAPDQWVENCKAVGGKVEIGSRLGPKNMLYTTRECIVTKP